jgi:hypothetical protein
MLAVSSDEHIFEVETGTFGNGSSGYWIETEKNNPSRNEQVFEHENV